MRKIGRIKIRIRKKYEHRKLKLPEERLRHGPKQPITLQWLTRLSLSDVGRLTTISISHLSRIFRGERKPSANSLRLVAAALRMPMETLDDALELARRDWRLAHPRAFQPKPSSLSTAPPSSSAPAHAAAEPPIPASATVSTIPTGNG